MFDSQPQSGLAGQERRRHPRYPVVERLNLAVDDISLGGLRVSRLPKHTEVRAGDRLGLLLIGEEQALSLRAEVVHHGTTDSFGVEFRDLSAAEQREIDNL